VGLCPTWWPFSEYRWRPLLKITRSETSVIPFLVPRHKVWLTPTAWVPFSNAANYRRTQDLDAHRIFHLAAFRYGARPQKCINCVPARRRSNIAQSLVDLRWAMLLLPFIVWWIKAVWNPLKFAGVPQICQPLTAVSGPKFTILCGHVEEVLLCNKFFPIVDTYLKLRRYSLTKLCDGAQIAIFLHNFCVLYFQRAACSTFQTCILNSH